MEHGIANIGNRTTVAIEDTLKCEGLFILSADDVICSAGHAYIIHQDKMTCPVAGVQADLVHLVGCPNLVWISGCSVTAAVLCNGLIGIAEVVSGVHIVGLGCKYILLIRSAGEGLGPAVFFDLPDGIGRRSVEIFKEVHPVGIGHDIGVGSRVELIVAVGVEVNFPTGQCRFTRIPGSVAVSIVEFIAADITGNLINRRS